jgi:flagellar hook-associated protein 1 FlgK
MSSILNTGSSALLAFQRALATVSHNVANVATPGYNRQGVVLTSRPGQFIGSGFLGSGVQMVGVHRSSDRFITERALDSGAEVGRLSAFATQSGRTDRRFSDPTSGLASPFSAFFDATQGVSSQPASGASRRDLLARGEALASRFRTLAGSLDAQDREISERLLGLTTEVNGLGEQIARLNVEIVRQQGMAGGQPPNDLLDKRDLLVSELNTKVGVTTVEQDDGALNVFTTGGQSLVVGDVVAKLKTIADPYRRDRLIVALDLNGDSAVLNTSALGGEVGGLLEFRSTTQDPALADLGRMAAGLAFEFNQQHRAGMDMYGQRGGDFFVATAPRVLSHALNSGSGTINASIAGSSALTGADIELSFNGTVWAAVDARNGQGVAMTGTGTAGDPFIVGGMRLEMLGTANAGDRFLVQPTAGAGGQMRLAISDPNAIAAALPVRANADVSNLGNASIVQLTVVDANQVALLIPVDIEFIDATSYTVNGGGPFVYGGGPIAANGWSLQLDGVPIAGDRFRVSANAPGSTDNGNARMFAALDERRFLSAGTVSLNDEMGRLTSSIGSAARQAQNSLDAQGFIDQQLASDREAVSGVNLDEEAANMLRFQQAYQAAAQVISVADTVFQSLLAATRR